MTIFFCCHEISLLSYFAVEAYLNRNRKPSYEEIMTLIKEKYKGKNNSTSGKLIKLTDNVYLLEVNKHYEIIKKALTGFNRIFNNNYQISFYNLNKYENYLIKTGYFLKKIRLNIISERLIYYGIKYSATELLNHNWYLET